MLAFEREIGEGYLSTTSTFLDCVCHPKLQGSCIKGAVYHHYLEVEKYPMMFNHRC